MVKTTNYQLIKKLNKTEIRLYENLIIAEVKGYEDRGFNFLFNYISGNNISKTNLEMTSPVLSENIEMTAPVLSEKNSISFIMPEGYTLENTPKPNDKRIEIKEIPKRYIAALKFSGSWANSKFKDKSKELLFALESSKIKTKGNIFLMRYSSPFTPWFLRRNEVAIEIDYK